MPENMDAMVEASRVFGNFSRSKDVRSLLVQHKGIIHLSCLFNYFVMGLRFLSIQYLALVSYHHANPEPICNWIVLVDNSTLSGYSLYFFLSQIIVHHKIFSDSYWFKLTTWPGSVRPRRDTISPLCPSEENARMDSARPWNENFLTVIPYFSANARCRLLKSQAVRMVEYLIDLHLVGFDCFSTGARKKI